MTALKISGHCHKIPTAVTLSIIIQSLTNFGHTCIRQNVSRLFLALRKIRKRSDVIIHIKEKLVARHYTARHGKGAILDGRHEIGGQPTNTFDYKFLAKELLVCKIRGTNPLAKKKKKKDSSVLKCK